MGFSQEDIRKYLRLESAAMISKWENGSRMPSGENLLKLSALYKTLVNDLYYTLAKEFQAELFPAESEVIFGPKKKRFKKSIRGP